MRRRAFVARGLAAAAVVGAGCAGPGGEDGGEDGNGEENGENGGGEGSE